MTYNVFGGTLKPALLLYSPSVVLFLLCFYCFYSLFTYICAFAVWIFSRSVVSKTTVLSIENAYNLVVDYCCFREEVNNHEDLDLNISCRTQQFLFSGTKLQQLR